MMQMEIEIRHELEGSARVLVFNRPTKKNALTVAMYAVLAEQLADAASQPVVRAVVLTGAGDAFTAGNDIHDFIATPPTGDDSPVLRFLGELVRFPKPILAAVNGAAIGVGTTMLLHCDLVLASETARFQMPFTKLGLVPEGGSSFLLPRLAGLQKASELLIWGEPFDAAAAERAGIVNEVVAPDELMSRALARVESLRELPPETVRATKALLRDSLREPLGKAMRREAETFRARLSSSEALEAFTAFFEKRKPHFP
jgi:enoyl-CoA hydratase/carnithine racemase